MDDLESNQLRLARKYLKLKLLEDDVNFRRHIQERKHLHYLITTTIENGESHSAVIVGPRGCGKTTLVNSVLSELSERPCFEDDVIIVRLCGLLHSDEKVALNSITSQMGLDNAVGDRVFGSFSENFTYLLNCLRSGEDRSCRSIIFIMDEFHHFCHASASQNLLYNLFDVSHNQVAPICVVGVTCRLNFMELMEKRIKSRFSQRHIFIFPDEDLDAIDQDSDNKKTPVDRRLELFVKLLSLPSKLTPSTKVTSEKPKKRRKEKDGKQKKKQPSDISDMLDDMHVDIQGNGGIDEFIVPQKVLERCNSNIEEFAGFDPIFVSIWNKHIETLAKDKNVIAALDRQYYYSISERIFRDMLYRVVSRISLAHPNMEPSDVQLVVSKSLDENGKVFLIQSVSVLELSLLIAMKHQTDIYDGQPMNFEMVLNRYTKYANSNSSLQSVPRTVVMKAFEHLRDLELIAPYKTTAFGHSNSTQSRMQKEYQLYSLKVTADEINEGIRKYKNLPTEICQWVLNSAV